MGKKSIGLLPRRDLKHRSKKRGLVVYTATMLVIAASLALLIGMLGTSAELTPLEEGWEYRWDVDEPWLPVSYPSNPPERDGRDRVYYRISLPAYGYVTPALFVYAIDTAAEFSIRGEPIYSFGDMKDGRFAGWPWHLIDLSMADAGAYLDIEVVSDYMDIGLFGDILLGERADQLERLYRRDIPRYVICAVSLVVACMFFGIFVSMRSLKVFMYSAVGAFALAVRVYALSLTRQVVFFSPLLWEYVKLVTYIAVPIALAFSVGEIVKGYTARVTKYIALVYLAALIVMVMGPLLGIYPVTANYTILDILTLVALGTVAFMSLRAGQKGSIEAFFIAVNFLIVGLFFVYSMLMYRGLAPWGDEIDFVMLFQLTVGLLFVLVRRFILAHSELRDANVALEERVQKRTAELSRTNLLLEKEKRKLETLSITDGLTGMRTRAYVLDRLRKELSEAARYGRPLSIVMFDIDHFKLVNDNHGHQTGDCVLMEVTRTIASVLRDSDILGRYGGEEFLAVLPETGLSEAVAVSERVRNRVGALVFGEGIPSVTISGGAAEYRGENFEELLRRADVRLYEAKANGRNAIMG